MIKLLLTFYFTLLISFLNARTINLDYEPKGKIIEFHFDSLTIYTDTTALFNIYRHNGTLKDYDLRIMNLVRKELNKTKNDTVSFFGNFIPFNDNIKHINQNDWWVDWAVFELTKANKLQIYDKKGRAVTRIKSKKVGTKKEGYIRKAFINKDTNEELFSQSLYIITGTPSF